MRIGFSMCSLDSVTTNLLFCHGDTDRRRRHHFVSITQHIVTGQRPRCCCRGSINIVGSHQVFCPFCKSLHICHLTTVKIWSVQVLVNKAAWAGWMLATLIAAKVSRVEMSRKRLWFRIFLARTGGWPMCWSSPIPQTRKSYHGQFGVWTWHGKCRRYLVE